MRRVINFITGAVLLLTIAAFFVLNYENGKTVADDLKSSFENWDEKVKNDQSFLEDNFKYRESFIDLYGLAMDRSGRRIIGNMEFIKDDNGIIQQITQPDQINDDSPFLLSYKELMMRAEELGTPLVYLALPDKTDGFLPVDSGELSAYGWISEQAAAKLEENGADCLWLKDKIAVDPSAPKSKDFYLKTDGHPTTYAEFWSAKRLAMYLHEKYDVQFPEFDAVFNLENYEIKRYDFLGNEVRSSGKTFCGIDSFEIYHPRFQTNLFYYNMYNREERQGDFDDVMLNGYENNYYDVYTYWITDFGHFESSCFRYINYNAPENAPRLLIISDSTFMTGFTYLTLACKSLTVADPRYLWGTEDLANILSEESFDAIVFVGQSASSLNYRSYINIPELPEKTMISCEEYGQYFEPQGICPGVKCGDAYYDSSEIAALGGALPVSLGREYVLIDGWGVDFDHEASYQALYIRVGDKYLQCRYHLETRPVVDIYGKESMLNSGLLIMFPTSLLEGGAVQEVEFIAVSADGQNLYRRTYPLTYI